mmetsp:Transcript_31844/g.71564  ORF Transcript_31844/g.71564 Transcript_31844/m.71564 type:complete len:204 (-) Transcript_31844:279-890(-)
MKACCFLHFAERTHRCSTTSLTWDAQATCSNHMRYVSFTSLVCCRRRDSCRMNLVREHSKTLAFSLLKAIEMIRIARCCTEHLSLCACRLLIPFHAKNKHGPKSWITAKCDRTIAWQMNRDSFTYQDHAKYTFRICDLLWHFRRVCTNSDCLNLDLFEKRISVQLFHTCFCLLRQICRSTRIRTRCLIFPETDILRHWTIHRD